MDDILWPFTNSFGVVYLNDILIFSKSWAYHLRHIQQVLNTLRKHQLYTNLEKCSFGMTRVQYYIVYEHGVHVDPAKIQAIQDRLTPIKLTELHSFLWLTNFYYRFMLGFSHIAWALNQVTKVDGKDKFVWSESQ